MFDFLSFLVGLFGGVSLTLVGAMIVAVNMKNKSQ